MAFRPYPKPTPTPKKPKWLRRRSGVVKVLKSKDIKGKKLPKEETLDDLEKALDAVFSHFVRLSYADENGNCNCCTCGKLFHWTRIQNGHFITRGCYPLRWEFKNCGPQCYSDNIHKEGLKYEHSVWLKKQFGDDVIEWLQSKKKNKFKLERFVLRHLIAEFTLKVAELKIQKGL